MEILGGRGYIGNIGRETVNSRDIGGRYWKAGSEGGD